MQRIAEAYFRLLKVAVVSCLAVMVVLVFGNVVLRYGFNSGITVSEELARLMFLYLTFLGSVIAMRERRHMGFDSLVQSLPPAAQRACEIVGHLLMLFVTAVFLRGSWEQTVINLEVKMPVTGLSMALVYGVGLVFCVSVGLILLHDLYRVLTARGLGSVCETATGPTQHCAAARDTRVADAQRSAA